MKLTYKAHFFHSILVLLGFATATSCEYIFPFVAEYGTPSMDFEVSGKVVDQDSSPITGIKISCDRYSISDTAAVYSAADGSFSISGKSIGAILTFEDVDGPENGGEFADKTEAINVDQVEKGDGHWYMGKYEAKNVVIQMEKK